MEHHDPLGSLSHDFVSQKNDYDLTPPQPVDSEDWLLTYTDLVTLLITLFIVMVAHASFTHHTGDGESGQFPLVINFPQVFKDSPAGVVQTGKPFNEKADHFDDGIGDADTRTTSALTEQEDVPKTDPEKVKRTKQLQADLQQAGLQDQVDVQLVSNEIELKINEKVLFPSAKADLFPEGQDLLHHILPTLKDGDYQIIVEGHTDNIAISTDKFPSNWELSAARAISVIHFFEMQGLQVNKMQAVAFGETRPIAPNDTEEGRQTNRRVQIILR
jgi:chemotaxis protein MotB